MRKLKLQMQVTIDGFISGPEGQMDWLTFPWTADINAYVGQLTESFDTIVLGRNLAQGFIPHWATVAADPKNPDQAAGVKFTDTPKVVFTRTLDSHEWGNTTLAKGELAAEIRQLKEQAGRDIIAYGGGTFVSSLLQEDLIDELFLFVNPAIIGSGKSVFSGISGTTRLKLVESKQFDCGIVVLRYEKTAA